jgi:hypothetical protein
MLARTSTLALAATFFRKAPRTLSHLEATRPLSTIGGKKNSINVTFISPAGQKTKVDALVGDSLLEIAHANNIDVEGL